MALYKRVHLNKMPDGFNDPVYILWDRFVAVGSVRSPTTHKHNTNFIDFFLFFNPTLEMFNQMLEMLILSLPLK